MKNSRFYKQAELLLRILPIIDREKVFALKGGTAINFFVWNLPRLSVDIDLAYLPIKDRAASLKEISDSLECIESNISKLIPGTKCHRKFIDNAVTGLIVSSDNAIVKIEPNTTIRGSVYPPVEYSLCNEGKELFELSVKVRSLVLEELYAGKICAALDRQHPRDFYDIKMLLDNKGISEKTRKAFIVYLISHNRPIAELLKPNFLNIENLFLQEFAGMTNESIGLAELIKTREVLVKNINESLTDSEKKFLISFKSTNPDWGLLGLNEVENLPAVKWKLFNLKQMDPKKHISALSKLENLLTNTTSI
jgi:predicted nucleotidyltransferase component of viral defense system